MPPPPLITVYADTDHPSQVAVPVVPAGVR